MSGYEKLFTELIIALLVRQNIKTFRLDRIIEDMNVLEASKHPISKEYFLEYLFERSESGYYGNMAQALLNQVNDRLSLVNEAPHLLTFQSTLPSKAADHILDNCEYPDLLELAKVLINDLL